MLSYLVKRSIVSMLLATSIFAFGTPAAAGDLKSRYFAKTQTLKIKLTGRIDAPATAELRDIVGQWSGEARTFELILDSRGGKVRAMRRVIAVLKTLKKTHRVNTTVLAGRTCGSACVPVFLQGQRRTASLASLWLFHEIDGRDRSNGDKVLKSGKSERLFDQLYLPAGVSKPWLEDIKLYVRGANLWQTGRQLKEAKSGIAHRWTDGRVVRRFNRIQH